jgi:glycine/serine hydroxymethyltransferase
VTSRGLRRLELEQLAELIADVLDDLASNGGKASTAAGERARHEVAGLAQRFPIYPKADGR